MSRIKVPDLPGRLQPAEGRGFDSDSDWWRLEVGAAGFGAVEAAGFHVEQCRFRGTDMAAGSWRNGMFRDCRLESVNVAGVMAQRCSMLGSQVSGARATGLQWTDGVFKDVTFQDCRLDLAGFRFSRFTRVEFVECRMEQVDFTGADLSGVRFVGCDLRSVKLNEAKAVGARFERCSLEGMSGVEALAGATVMAADLVPLTFTLAGALGISIETGELLRDCQQDCRVGYGGEAVPGGRDDQKVAFAAGFGVVAGVEPDDP